MPSTGTAPVLAANAIAGYRFTASVVVGLMFGICTVLLAAYKLDKRATIEMADALARRRAGSAPCAS